MNRAEQHQAFVAQMERKQTERKEEVGDHTWRKFADQYGPGVLFFEVASITSRLEQLLWRQQPKPEQYERIKDLAVDLGNYADFIYQWVEQQ